MSDDPAPPPRRDDAPSIVQAGLKGLCPRCGAASLYAGLLRFRDRCAACGLDLTRFNVGDGPAAFLTLILGALVVGLAIWLQVKVAPPWWVHGLIWVPFMTVATIASLRVAKAMLLWAEYRNAAREGRIEP
ncbi:DUF983 domain-containing protein [Sphingomonas abaci]|uniref:Uncharacterized protein (DUF983 family) n=1 Tax=Sphingomonas abaci TaxID=237611 RepID=A0A7W7AGC9_9SPHN|nr:DUF983 domain-containing protein [Sphingomonas abaci]MBB4616525.1 uncharacterized protein (DUF983 family) [Sphingomonas abaci]